MVKRAAAVDEGAAPRPGLGLERPIRGSQKNCVLLEARCELDESLRNPPGGKLRLRSIALRLGRLTMQTTRTNGTEPAGSALHFRTNILGGFP
jgi:hypothetical protein